MPECPPPPRARPRAAGPTFLGDTPGSETPQEPRGLRVKASPVYWFAAVGKLAF